MSRFVIRAEGVSKEYRLGPTKKKYETLRDTLMKAVAGLWRNNTQPAAAESFLALNDVSFEIQQGEVIGVIGRNGAGKSTLLKVLSRITEPSAGYAEITGRVGSLLEVGTGFHPELSGRENIYLNGAILGMRKVEISRKFDEIVAFAEVERFIDSPVKHYSSGMYLKLAFAVAAHLEPEILLIDEVLAVGDTNFQKKCLGKMGDVATQGRTVLFVSHNMVAVEGLCQRALWLQDGELAQFGPTNEVVRSYLTAATQAMNEKLWPDPQTAPGNEQVRLHRVAVRPVAGDTTQEINIRTPLVIEFEYWNLVEGNCLDISFLLNNDKGNPVFTANTYLEPQWHSRPMPAGLYRSSCYIPGDLLNDDGYSILLYVAKNDTTAIYKHPDLINFRVNDSAERRASFFGKWPGAVRPFLKWETEKLLQDNSLSRQAANNS